MITAQENQSIRLGFLGIERKKDDKILNVVLELVPPRDEKYLTHAKQDLITS